MTTIINNTIYSSEKLSLYYTKKPITVLTTDKGFFTDKHNKMIGKIIIVYLCQDLEGNIYYEAPYQFITQHFPGGDSWKYTFNGETYVRE